MNQDVYVTMTCNPFGDGRREYDLLVTPSGEVRVRDDTGGWPGIYTICHSLSGADQTRARRLALRESPRVAQ